MENLALSPQCGFASHGNNVMTEEEQEAKLRLVAETAKMAWG
jgi:5-methyltetrahydropteroyltriglutamate--homocysteine methyltransferase